MQIIIWSFVPHCMQCSYCARARVRSTIEINQFPYSVYHAFLKYLYTDSITEGLSQDDTVGKDSITVAIISLTHE